MVEHMKRLIVNVGGNDIQKEGLKNMNNPFTMRDYRWDLDNFDKPKTCLNVWQKRYGSS